ncbi:MAG TPA: hypothetical protein VL545_02040, partial [Rhodanobacter sp.]|nr:hypothetical protein [Rhodanobacter sp.]
PPWAAASIFNASNPRHPFIQSPPDRPTIKPLISFARTKPAAHDKLRELQSGACRRAEPIASARQSFDFASAFAFAEMQTFPSLTEYQH